MKTNHNQPFRKAFCFAAILVAGSFAVTAAPIVEYKFNETSGSVAPSTGTLSSNALLQNGAVFSTSPNLGVSGQAGDFALDLTSAAGMGSTGGNALINNNSNLNNLWSFTLVMWIKSDTVFGSSARLLDTSSLVLYAGGSNPGPGQLSLNVNGTQVNSSAVYTATNEWIFIAVTYDGTLTLDNVNLYIGGIDTAATLVETRTLNKGQAANTGDWRIGNFGSLNRAYDGYIDNLQIHGSKTADSLGVLSLSQLEAIRLNAIPEPSAVALVLIALLLLAFRRGGRVLTRRV